MPGGGCSSRRTRASQGTAHSSSVGEQLQLARCRGGITHFHYSLANTPTCRAAECVCPARFPEGFLHTFSPKTTVATRRSQSSTRQAAPRGHSRNPCAQGCHLAGDCSPCAAVFLHLSPLLVHFCSFSLPVFPSCAQLGVGAVLTSQWSHLVLFLSLLFPCLPSLHISCHALLVLPFPALPISLLPPSKPFALLSPRSHPPTRCSHAHHVPSMQPTSHISWKTKPGSQSLKINIAWDVRDGFHWLNNSTLGLFSAF